VRKAFQAVVALILILAVPADAATTLSRYSLIVDGKQVALTADTGYIGKSGSWLTIPLKAVCDALSIEYSLTNGGRLMYMQGSNKARVAVCSGYAYAKVDGKRSALVKLIEGRQMKDESIGTEAARRG
jgi:hypothetical protein